MGNLTTYIFIFILMLVGYGLNKAFYLKAIDEHELAIQNLHDLGEEYKLMQVEWSFITNPSYVDMLATKYLGYGEDGQKPILLSDYNDYFATQTVVSSWLGQEDSNLNLR